MTGKIDTDINTLQNDLKVDLSFDLIMRRMEIAGKSAAFFFVDGFCKDAIVEKLLEYLFKITPEEFRSVKGADGFLVKMMPYVEAATAFDYETVKTNILSGQFVILIDGFDKAICIDTREYPVRSISEPDKDRALRGARDSFSETLIFNTALIRRRIRDEKLRMEYLQIGSVSKSDIAICYIEGKANKREVEEVKKRLKKIKTPSISMANSSISELILPTSFFNPLPKIKYTERPDFAAASVIEGRIALLIDNSPVVMIFANSFFDFLRDVDDYYFPPLTASYLRITRVIVSFFTVFLTPVVILFYNNPEWLPKSFHFLLPREDSLIPFFFQFLLLEFIVDGLKLASINTPTSMSSSLGIIGGLLLSDFAIAAGWFVPDTIVYISFVAIASYAQPSLEIGYTMKFFRMVLFVLTNYLSYWGLLGGTAVMVLVLTLTKTISGRRYFYPVIPFNFKNFCRIFIRTKLKSEGGKENGTAD